MKIVFVRSCLAIIIGATGCAVGSRTEMDEPTPELPGLDAGSSAEPASTPLVDAGNRAVDGSASPPRDAASSFASEGGALAADAGPAVPVPPPVVPPLANEAGACAWAMAGSLVAFDFASLKGASATAPATATAPGLVVTPLTRVGVSAVAGSGALNASSWPTASTPGAKYFSFAITAPAGCSVTLTTLDIDLERSSSGPETAAVGSSVDNFGAAASFPVSTKGGAVVVPVPAVSAGGGSVEVRIFGFGADSAGGTMRVQGVLRLTGSVS